jgi:hypothetical protein
MSLQPLFYIPNFIMHFATDTLEFNKFSMINSQPLTPTERLEQLLDTHAAVGPCLRELMALEKPGKSSQARKQKESDLLFRHTLANSPTVPPNLKIDAEIAYVNRARVCRKHGILRVEQVQILQSTLQGKEKTG